MLAAAIAFLILPRLYKSQSATESILRIVKDVPAGTVITGDMITVSEVGAFGLPADVLRDKEDAVGMVAIETLYAGEYLNGKRLMSAADYAASEESRKKGLKGGMNLVTIEFPSYSAGVAGVLRAGDTVDVYEYKTEENEDGEKVSYAELSMIGLYVCDVLNRNMQSLNELDALKAALPEDDNTVYDFAPAYVVFRCTTSQIVKLIELERADTLHLTLTKAVNG